MLDKKELFQKLAEGYSVQSKTTNRFWLVLLIACIISLTGSVDEKNLIEMPFTLGKVGPKDFYSVSLVLLSILAIVFTSAMIQAIRTRILLQKIIADLVSKGHEYIEGIHIQDILDSIVVPTYNRVAPISQFLLGRNQFFSPSQKNTLIKKVATVLYAILKILTLVVIYLLPFFAIRKCWNYLNEHGSHGTIYIPNYLITILISAASVCFAILFIADILYAGRAIIRINK